MVALYRISKKRAFRRMKTPQYDGWKVYDECIFCEQKKELFFHKYGDVAQTYLDQNPLKFTSLIDCKGFWK
jgi:hypothetical protein